MNNIFYLHSNICVISVYKTIENYINKGEHVIIVSERKTIFPIESDRIDTYDIQEVIDNSIKQTSNVLVKILNYKFSVYKQCEKFASSIIGKEDFVLYTPSYNMYSVRPFLKDEHCKGYYFIEEGVLSYLTSRSLHTRYIERRYKQGRILLELFGMGEVPDCLITNKFKGCLCLSEHAFPWCKHEKIVTGIASYFDNMDFCDIETNDIIITDWLRDDIDIIEDAFRRVVERLMTDQKHKVAIKFHPQAHTYEKDKIVTVLNYLKNRYSSLETIILPADYPLELLMYHKTMNVYSIFGHSSVLLYALILKSNAFAIVHNGNKSLIRAIPTVPQFIDEINLNYAR